MANDADPTPFSNFSLREVLAILRANRWLVLFCIAGAFSTSLVGTLLTTKQYRATALIELTPASGKEVKVDDVMDREVRGVYEIERFYRTELAIMRTRVVAGEAVRRYAELQYDDIDAETGTARLLGMLSIVPRERSNLIELSITHPDPDRAALLATLYAQTYIEMNLESRRGASRDAKEWLEQKIQEYEDRVAADAAAMISYKRTYDVIDLEENATAVSARMDQIDTRYAQVSTDRLLLSTKLTGYETLFRQGKVVELAEVLGTPTLLALSRIYADARATHATIGARYGERHSTYQESDAALTRIRDELRREVRSALEAERARLSLYEAEEASLLEAIDSVGESLLVRQRHQAEFDQLRLAYERSEAFLKRLSTRSDELALSSRTQLNNAMMREPARAPGRPVSPNLLLNLMVGLIVGLTAGLGLAVLRHLIDDSISSPEDVANFLETPFLGMVPKVDAPPGPASDLHTYRENRSLAAESMRGIRALLEMNPDGRRVRRLLVTSAVASEGKTSICVRIGIAYAQFGRRVLLLDADHHRPRVHKVFDLPNEVGTLDILRGEMSIEAAVLDTEVPDMHVLPLGRRRPDAARLFASDAFSALLDELQNRYDLVIIDTPPSATLSEAIQLSPIADGVVLVVRAGQVSRRVVRHTVDRFRKVNARILGTVLNDVEPIATGAYGYLYGYKYGYGPYGGAPYGTDPDDEDDEARNEDDEKAAG